MLTGREIEMYDDPAAGFFAPAADEDLPKLPIRLHYSAKQVEFIRATEWLTGFVGAIRAGKTYGLMGWVSDKMYEQRGTGTIGGIFANTYSQLSQSTLPELWEVFNKLGFEHGKDYVYNEAPPAAWNYPSRFKKKHDATLTVRYWGQCIVRSLDQPETIRGVTLGWAAIDEARGATEAAFDVVIGRVSCKRCTRPQIKLATSPNGYDWIYERLVDKAPKSCRRIHATTAENAANLLPGYVDQLRGMYDPAMAEQELEGKFVRIATGAVFRCFDRNVHVGDDVTLDADADLHVSYDFNRTPFAIVIAQVRNYPAGPGLAFIDEIALRDADTQLASEELVRRITSLYPPGKSPRSVQVHGDAAGRQRNTKNNWSDYDIVTKVLGAAYGARFVPRWPMSNPGVIESINAVNGLLKNSLGQVRVRIHPRCAKLIRDFEQVSFRPGSTDIDKVTNKDLTHWCLAPGTMIDLADGPCRIEDAPPIGFVRAFDGEYIPYDWAGETRSDAELVEVELDDGTAVVCTPDHQFLTERGWVRADALRYLLLYSWRCGYQTRSSSPSTDRTSWASRIGGMAGTSSADVSGSTWRYGWPTTAQSPAARESFTSITRTKTRRTTGTPIFVSNIWKTISEIMRGRRNVEPYRDTTSIGRGQPRPHGTEVPRGWLGTPNTIAASASTCCMSPSARGANGAANGLTARSIRDSVTLTARWPNDVLAEPTMRNVIASVVESHFKRTGTSRPPIVLSHARRVLNTRPVGRGRVYCLHVPGDGCFSLANGLVVSNCDGARYMIEELFPIATRSGVNITI